MLNLCSIERVDRMRFSCDMVLGIEQNYNYKNDIAYSAIFYDTLKNL